ncbi:MAG: hypothetical protein JOZ69_24910 [Myxococcales bacterium]|nr:hypothetical protein [Myxococcales bacterium]
MNKAMVRPLHGEAADVGSETRIVLEGGEAEGLVAGQKIDFGGKTGLVVLRPNGKREPLAGTYLVASVDGPRVTLMDAIDRKPVASAGSFDRAEATVATYRLVGPQYFQFFALVMCAVGLLFTVWSRTYREKTHLRDEGSVATA